METIARYWKAIGSALGALPGVLTAVAGLLPDKYAAILAGIGALLGTYFAPKNAD